MLLSRLMIFNQKEEECRQMEAYFEESGYGVISCSDLDELMDIISKGRHKPEVFVFYIDDSGRKGYDIIEKVRAVSDMAIIIISKDSRLDTQLYAYSKKIDDYMAEPVPLPLLEAHVEAILRRFSEKKLSVETAGAITIDYESRKIYLEGKALKVTAKEFDLMELLMRNPGRVYSRENLLNVVWGYEYIGDYRTVDVHVRRLREKLELDPANPEYIRTKWGIGYYLSNRTPNVT